MRYRITHRTAYTYSEPAHESFNEVRLRPVSDNVQTCLSFNLTIDPPATVIEFEDYYGNAVHDFGVPYLHDQLVIEATSDVVTFAGLDQPLSGPAADEPDRSPALAAVNADPLFADAHIEFLIPSGYVALDGATSDVSRSLLRSLGAPTAFQFLLAASDHVHQRLSYEIGATTVHTTVAEVLEGGSGVCQDFAHLLIALCRHAGLPARYVSGYLGDVRESTASHAWVEAFVPPHGWIGIDPTHGARCTGRHIKLGVGRDYADVAVVRGVFRGGAETTMAVRVVSEEITTSRELAMPGPDERGRGRRGLVQTQTLGAARQQRLDAMSLAVGQMGRPVRGMSMSMSMQQSIGGDFAGYGGPGQEEGAPRQQPQQQQQ